MTLQDFIEVLNDNWVEVVGSSARDQCVDLANAYLRSVLKQPVIEWTNAIDFPAKVDSSQFDWIENSPTGVPQEGDIVIWGGTRYGHIAIFLEGDANRFVSFDQNWPTGSSCHGQEHDYTNVKGWLHFKGTIPQSSQEQLDACTRDRNNHWNELLWIKEQLGITGDYSHSVVAAKLETVTKYEDQIRADEKALKAAQDRGLELESQLKQRDTQIAELNKKFEEYQLKIEQEIGVPMQNLIMENESLKKEVEKYKIQVAAAPVIPTEFLEKNKYILIGAATVIVTILGGIALLKG